VGIVASRVSIDELPEEYRDLFAEARRLDRPVLFDFTAPG